MPGWLIQGVRGEGKTLCAVHLARKYLNQGRVVATNLDLYLDKLLPEDNETIAYRLPDQPRYEDFLVLGSAYDPKYKGEDKNGLLILDELGTWLNSRTWKSSGRDDLLNWLFLSRKYHWDIVLLAQDHEMIDKQAKTTLCDFLVQASRTDRSTVPFFSGFLKLLGFSGYMPKRHEYHIYYGFNSLGNSPVDKWVVEGTDLYSGYDTNQIFTDGKEVYEINGKAKVVDMRATYTYLPASYLTGHKFLFPIEKNLEQIQKIFKKDKIMAFKKVSKNDQKFKIIMLSVVLVCFVVYRLFSGFSVPGQTQTAKNHNEKSFIAKASQTVSSVNVLDSNVQNTGFVDRLIARTRPRLAAYLYNRQKGGYGLIEFYEGSELVERFTTEQLKAFGVAIIRRPYGVDLVTSTRTYEVTAWPRPKSETVQTVDMGGNLDAV